MLMNVDTTFPLVLWPDKFLEQKSELVLKFKDSSTNQLIIDMMLMLNTLKGQGLSANQIASKQAILVYKVDKQEGYMINPQIVLHSPQVHLSSEQCLSLPGIQVKIPRWDSVTINWQDNDGISQQETFQGLIGDCIQHEIDHLNGVTIISSFSKLKRDIISKKLQKRYKQINLRQRKSKHE